MLGKIIRNIRKEKDYTLNEISKRTQLSSSYISQLERGLIEPSLSSLRKISEALEVPIYTFLKNDNKEHVVIKADQRRKLELPDTSIIYEFVSPMVSDKKTNPRMEIIYFQLKPNSWGSDDYINHKADECIFIIEGELEIYLGDNKYILNAGDSIYIHENVPHKTYNPGSKKVIGLSTISPPIY